MKHLLIPAVFFMISAQAQAAADEVAVTSYSDPSLPTHTIYRPETLDGALPVVLWGNGSCVNSNFSYREFLTSVAAHGFIVVAVGPWRDSPAPRQQRPQDPAEWPPFETNAQQLLDGLDWIATANSNPANLLAGHVDTSHVAAMGHSCGAIQALQVSPDQRISTTLVLNSGLFPDGDQYMARFGITRALLGQLHAPVAWFIGGETDVAYVNAEQDWREIQAMKIPAINANMDVGHGATYSQPRGGPFASGPLAWLQWQLKGDDTAAAMFRGANCGFCNSDEWLLRTHNLE